MRSSLPAPAPSPAALHREPRWYACRTRARAEKQVDRLLLRAGFEAYLPLVEQERTWADRKKRVPFPLFPGYTFVRAEPVCLGDVVRTPGLVEVVGGLAQPAPVRDEELEAVRLLTTGAAALEQAPELVDWLEPGTPVEVTDGPFRGMRGVLVQVRGTARVAVRLTAIRLAAAVELDAAVVRKVA